MQEYLGVEVTDDAHGVLQDVHWSRGTIGYFSTYALGNVISVQIWDKVLEDVPDLYDHIERGDLDAADGLAPREAVAPRPQVHAAGDAGAGRRRRDGPRAVPAVPELEARRARGVSGRIHQT